MQLSIDVIDAFRRVAHQIASGLRDIPFSTNIFRVAGIDLLQAYHLTDTELIMTYTGGSVDAEIAFANILPTKILSVEIEEPIKIRESVKSVALDTWNNAGSTPLKETEKWTKEHTITEQLDIVSSIEVGIKEKIGAEYAGFKAELEANLTAKLGINHSTQEQNKTIDERSQEIEIPPFKRVSLVQKKSICDFSQVIRTHCELGASVRISAGWEKRFDTLRELQLYFIGGGGGSGDVPDMDAFVNQRKFQSFDLPRLEFNVERDRLYKDVETGEVTRSEVDAH